MLNSREPVLSTTKTCEEIFFTIWTYQDQTAALQGTAAQLMIEISGHHSPWLCCTHTPTLHTMSRHLREWESDNRTQTQQRYKHDTLMTREQTQTVQEAPGSGHDTLQLWCVKGSVWVATFTVLKDLLVWASSSSSAVWYDSSSSSSSSRCIAALSGLMHESGRMTPLGKPSKWILRTTCTS